MLRALRFASVYGMTIEPGTAAAVHRNRALLERIAAERVQAELTKLLCGRGAAAVLRSFADVLEVLIPELVPMFGFDQRNPHHDRDVWEHTMRWWSIPRRSPSCAGRRCSMTWENRPAFR